MTFGFVGLFILGAAMFGYGLRSVWTTMLMSFTYSKD